MNDNDVKDSTTVVSQQPTVEAARKPSEISRTLLAWRTGRRAAATFQLAKHRSWS